jgi:acetyltransferase-like isoleucine patch superfamily enzyme
MNCGVKTKFYNQDTSNIDDGFICGTGCIIHAHVNIGKNVIFGNNVELGVFSKISNVVAEDNVKFANGVLVANVTEKGRVKNKKFSYTYFREGAKIGKDAKIVSGLTIGKHSRIGSGATVIEDVDDYTTVCGSPAMPHNHNCDHPTDHWGGKIGFK